MDVGLFGPEGQTMQAKMKDGQIVIQTCGAYTDLEVEACIPGRTVSMSEARFIDLATKQLFQTYWHDLKLTSEEVKSYKNRNEVLPSMETLTKQEAVLERKISYVKKYNASNSERYELEEQLKKTQDLIQSDAYSKNLVMVKKVDLMLKKRASELVTKIKQDKLTSLSSTDGSILLDYNLIVLAYVYEGRRFIPEVVYGHCRIKDVESGAWLIEFQQPWYQDRFSKVSSHKTEIEAKEQLYKHLTSDADDICVKHYDGDLL